MDIECKNFRPIKGGNFLGFADLILKDLGIELFGCTLYEKDSRRWVNLPTRSYKNKEGVEKYSQIVRFTRQETYREFCEKAKEAIDRYDKNDSGVTNDEIPF